MADARRPLNRAEALILDIAMMAALGGVEARDLPQLGQEALSLMRQMPVTGSPVGHIADRLGALAEQWQTGQRLWLEDLHLRHACARFFRGRYVRNRLPAGS